MVPENNEDLKTKNIILKTNNPEVKWKVIKLRMQPS